MKSWLYDILNVDEEVTTASQTSRLMLTNPQLEAIMVSRIAGQVELQLRNKMVNPQVVNFLMVNHLIANRLERSPQRKSNSQFLTI